MRALILGTGSIGRRHIASLQTLDPGTEFVLVRRDGRTDDFSAALRARVAGTIAEGIAGQPDLAVIATPSALHAEALLPLVAAGIPFYIEKPVVTSRAQLDSLSAALDRAGFSSPTLAGCNLRFLPSLQRLKASLSEGTAGRVVRASFQAGQWLPDWRPGRDYAKDYSADAARGGGVLLDLVHELDSARWLLGEFDQVRAVCGTFSALDVKADDTAVVLLARTGTGPAVSVGLDYVSRRKVRRYEIVGDQATLVWDLMERRLVRIGPQGEEPIAVDAAAFDMAPTYVAAMREFVNSVRTRGPTSQDVREGMKSAELAIRAKEAASA